jgi:hypothetical protein
MTYRELQLKSVRLRKQTLEAIFVTAGTLIALTVFVSGCVGTKYIFNPKEQMLVLQSHIHFLEIGPLRRIVELRRPTQHSFARQPLQMRCLTTGRVSKRQTQDRFRICDFGSNEQDRHN